MSYLFSLYRDFQRFPQAVRLFYASDVFYGLSTGISNTLLNLHLLAMGYTPDHVGILQSAGSLVIAAAAIPVGLVGDRWNRRHLYVAGSLLFGIPYLLAPWLSSFPLLVAVYALGMLGHTLMMVNESPILAGEVGPELRASVFSFMMVNFFVWQTLGIQLSGWLANWLPVGFRSTYEWPLVIAGVLGVASGLFRVAIPFRRQPVQTRTQPFRLDRVVLMLAAVNMLGGSFTALTYNFSNVILANRFAFRTEQIATVLTGAGILAWLGSLLAPGTSRRMGNARGYAMVVALQGVAFMGMGLAAAPGWFLPIFGIRSVLGSVQSILFSAFAMDVTPETERATANSIAMVGYNLGMALAAKGYGAALAANSYGLSFSVAGLLAFCTALLALVAFRQPARAEGSAAGKE